MANTNKKTTSASTEHLSAIKRFFKNEQVRFALGIVILFSLLYVFLALLSFLFTGGADQSVLDHYSTLSQSLDTKSGEALLAAQKELSALQHSVSNWTGYRGAVIAETLINGWLGVSVFFLLIFPLGLGIRLIGLPLMRLWRAIMMSVFGCVWGSVFFTFCFSWFSNNSFLNLGGRHGVEICRWLESNIGKPGVLLTLLASGLLFLIFSVSATIPFLKGLFGKKDTSSQKSVRPKNTAVVPDTDDDLSVRIGPEIVEPEWIESVTNDPDVDMPDVPVESVNTQDDSETDIPVESVVTENNDVTDQNYDTLEPYDPTKDLSSYVYPTLNLLKEYPQPANSITDSEKEANRTRITTTLLKFGIGIKKIYETIGPTITLYEIVPEDGIRINKIRNLADDIMLNLAATGIRIIAPIPGKGTIGIEVPNASPRIVSMYATIASKKFQESTFDLPVALGRTITNEVFMFDLCKMPHLLVAGATGQGKSVGLNAIITSLIYKKHPAQLKFVLVDPKKVEFNIYADIEHHFLAKLPDTGDPVITDTGKVVQTLNSLCKEMDQRYELLKMAHVRNIKEYNAKFIDRRLNPEKGHKYLPYIVVIVDEFGDLIMTAGKEVEMPIARIAQLARAVGIHMVIATQRPSVNIITGVIKANFPARIAFKVSAMVDSKTILDGSGAQQLIGRGDMLFSQGNDPVRVQCAFVDTPEVENIVHFIAEQRGYPSAFALPEIDSNESDIDMAASGKDSVRDAMFDEVARLVVATQQASASNIQRKFSIGFNRAARLIDQLEEAGIVGSPDGSKPRQVLVKTEYDLDRMLKLKPKN
jgi:S-DNA-T family DNA segregation ATPase FtsK/SpoIIIE